MNSASRRRWRQARFEGEARGRIEGPELAFVVELAPAPGLAAGRPGERAFAEEARARIFVADSSTPAPGFTAKNEVSPRSARAERNSRLRARIALSAAHEDRLDMHAGEIEIARIGAGFVRPRSRRSSSGADVARPAGHVAQPDAPAQDRGCLRSGPISIRASTPFSVWTIASRLKRRLFDPIVARAPRRLEADRPGRLAILAEIEEMAARLQRIERAADEVDRDAAALGAHRRRPRRARRAGSSSADRAVVEDVSLAAAARVRAGAPASQGPAPRSFARALCDRGKASRAPKTTMAAA